MEDFIEVNKLLDEFDEQLEKETKIHMTKLHKLVLNACDGRPPTDTIPEETTSQKKGETEGSNANAWALPEKFKRMAHDIRKDFLKIAEETADPNELYSAKWPEALDDLSKIELNVPIPKNRPKQNKSSRIFDPEFKSYRPHHTEYSPPIFKKSVASEGNKQKKSNAPDCKKKEDHENIILTPLEKKSIKAFKNCVAKILKGTEPVAQPNINAKSEAVASPESQSNISTTTNSNSKDSRKKKPNKKKDSKVPDAKPSPILPASDSRSGSNASVLKQGAVKQAAISVEPQCQFSIHPCKNCQMAKIRGKKLPQLTPKRIALKSSRSAIHDQLFKSYVPCPPPAPVQQPKTSKPISCKENALPAPPVESTSNPNTTPRTTTRNSLEQFLGPDPAMKNVLTTLRNKKSGSNTLKLVPIPNSLSSALKAVTTTTAYTTSSARMKNDDMRRIMRNKAEDRQRQREQQERLALQEQEALNLELNECMKKIAADDEKRGRKKVELPIIGNIKPIHAEDLRRQEAIKVPKMKSLVPVRKPEHVNACQTQSEDASKADEAKVKEERTPSPIKFLKNNLELCG